MTQRTRLDALVVERRLAATRARARALILAGQVRVNDAVHTKAGTAVATDARIRLSVPDWKLRRDSRVIPLEGINARRLTAAALPGGILPVDIVTIDVSFISLRLVLPVVPGLVADDGDVVALVKPQFEATRDEVGKGGIVRDRAVRRRAVRQVISAADALGLAYVSTTPAPRRDAAGNREYFVHLRRCATPSS